MDGDDDQLGVRFLRVRVLWNLNKPTKRGINLRIRPCRLVSVHFKYERLPNFRYTCGRIDNTLKECGYDADDEDDPKFGMRSYSDCLRASLRKSNAFINSDNFGIRVTGIIKCSHQSMKYASSMDHSTKEEDDDVATTIFQSCNHNLFEKESVLDDSLTESIEPATKEMRVMGNRKGLHESMKATSSINNFNMEDDGDVATTIIQSCNDSLSKKKSVLDDSLPKNIESVTKEMRVMGIGKCLHGSMKAASSIDHSDGEDDGDATKTIIQSRNDSLSEKESVLHDSLTENIEAITEGMRVLDIRKCLHESMKDVSSMDHSNREDGVMAITIIQSHNDSLSEKKSTLNDSLIENIEAVMERFRALMIDTNYIHYSKKGGVGGVDHSSAAIHKSNLDFTGSRSFEVIKDTNTKEPTDKSTLVTPKPIDNSTLDISHNIDPLRSDNTETQPTTNRKTPVKPRIPVTHTNKNPDSIPLQHIVISDPKDPVNSAQPEVIDPVLRVGKWKRLARKAHNSVSITLFPSQGKRKSEQEFSAVMDVDSGHTFRRSRDLSPPIEMLFKGIL